MHRFLPLLFCLAPVCVWAEQLPKLPLSFEKNQGQADARVDFLSRGHGYALFLTPREAVLRLGSDVLRMKLAGANGNAKAEGRDLLPGRSSYLIGNDSAQWRRGIANYQRVAYPEVYPGIDLIYYGNQRQLEYDFVVKPGADLQRIRLQFAGAKRVHADAAGDLVIETAGGEIRERKPVVFQTVAGKRQEIAGSYVVRHSGEVAFEVAAYDKAQALVIDPALVYSTYLGGEGGPDVIRSITLDSANNAYITGFTYSTDFPTANARQAKFGAGNTDAFVTKISADGTTLLYSTFLGGKGDDFGYGITVDADGNAYVTGSTSSPNFPLSRPIQGAYNGSFDVFITKLSPDGSQLLYSTYLGGNGTDTPVGIALDSQRNMYVAGNTTSSNFPNLSSFQSNIAGMQDVFVTKISADGSRFVYSTFLGGTLVDKAEGMGVDASGNAFVAGTTFSPDFPTVNPLQPRLASTFAGVPDGFVTKISADGLTKIYSTYLGGSEDDQIHAMVVDAAGNAYLTGQTSSSNFPSVGAFQKTYGGSGDAFITKINPDGSAHVYSSFLGGSGTEEGDAIAVDSNSNVFVTGITNSISFPTLNAIQGSFAGGATDIFVTKISPDGGAKLYSTFLGGTLDEHATGIAADANGNAYVVGTTTSLNFPIVIPAIQPVNLGGPAGGTQAAGLDSFILKVGLPRTISHVADGAGFHTTIILVNTGTQAANFDLKFWDETGNPMVVPLGTDGTNSEVSGTIEPGVARFIRTLGTSLVLQKGWAELTAPPTIDGNSIFGLQSPGRSDSEAAVPLSPSGGTQLYLPFDYSPGYSTGIAFADPNNQPATVSAALVDDTGLPIPSPNTILVPARGHYSDVLIAEFPAAVGHRGVAHFTANNNIFGLGIRANGKAFTSIEALAGVTSAPKTIAHIANGGGWKTTFLLVNTDSQPANFTMTFWDDNGLAFTLPLGLDGFASSLTDTIQPGDLRIVETTGAGANVLTGWAQLTVTGAISGTAIFALQTPGQSDSEAAVPFGTKGSTLLFMPYDYTTGYSTGVALTNPNTDQAATVYASIVDDSGHSLATGFFINVPANGHKSLVLGVDVFPNLIQGTRGTVSFTSNVPILGLGIRANGLAFTSLKVIAR